MAIPINDESIHILIIDDEPLNILALCAVLKSRGYTPLTAGSATEGLAMLDQSNTIKLVLMDMMMPDIDGYEATTRIKKSKHCGHIPVIAVTAQAMADDREKCLAAGVDDYVSKPIDIDVLSLVIKKHIK
ncbi:response regulator [Olivibacter sp. SDN3]|uniref:response regulator n=1 Tax=Olivibacter sp. SDN3 TaxID=2764720 RepID=UPI00165172B4|nr:response regulator [Olivibacter sp. SDN3]QNL50850.1 response regulator [Olivibacter sp. SDN3]